LPCWLLYAPGSAHRSCCAAGSCCQLPARHILPASAGGALLGRCCCSCRNKWADSACVQVHTHQGRLPTQARRAVLLSATARFKASPLHKSL
jgi:hypothetical protein